MYYARMEKNMMEKNMMEKNIRNILAMFSVNFDVFSIAFVIYLLNGVRFQFCFN